MTPNEITRAVTHGAQVIGSLAMLVGAGVCGAIFQASTMDLVLIQLVFYGAWAAQHGAFLGARVGAALEQDACTSLDMGVTSSIGALAGAVATGLLGTALAGLAFTVPWPWIFGAAVAIEVAQLVLRRFWHYRPRPPSASRLRMRDRSTLLLTSAVALMLGLTLLMAMLMRTDLGHPVMMAPMMYGMFGTSLGGLAGGWLGGLLDEHQGDAGHDNPIMVAGMALMAGMMGAMPAGMIGGMMAVMGPAAIAATVGATGVWSLLAWALCAGRRSPRVWSHFDTPGS